MARSRGVICIIIGSTIPAMADVPSSNSDPAPASGLAKLAQDRAVKIEQIRALGLDPYGQRTEDILAIDAARARFDATADAAFKARTPEAPAPDTRPVVRIAGRVVLHRDTGKLIFMNLRDATGDVQVAVSKRDCEEAGFGLAKLLDLGDLIIAQGPLGTTKTGEVTVWATRIIPAAKSLEPPPEKHAGLQDVELRYRQRYVDMWANPETIRVQRLRSMLLARLREFFAAREYVEVETPVLQALAGGAAARPFITHMNALDINLYLRVSPELYLKRLLVGGLPRVYEVSRNFRNEGLDRSHNPEFTMVECYEAFADYSVMMQLTESLVRDLAMHLSSRPEYFWLAAHRAKDSGAPPHVTPGHIDYAGHAIDYTRPFERIRYGDLFKRGLGFDMTDTDRVKAEAVRRGLKPMDHWLLVGELFEQSGEPLIDASRPTFVMDYPAALCPLTRSSRTEPDIAERFELYIGGMEIANAYTELNDPTIQEAKFREQLAGLDDEESTFRTLDEDFLRALRVGMPPAGGMGIGIDRLAMLLTGERSIRDVMLFPLMRPVEVRE